MKTIDLILGTLSVMLVACGTAGDGTSATSQAVVLDVRCANDSDCPLSFECEVEVEHGVETSFCVSHDEGAASAGECPSGFELEVEHGGTFCKPHGGDNASSGGTGSTGGAACTSSADCAPGLECEVEEEHGVTTMLCK
jgi:hypothetical protein